MKRSLFFALLMVVGSAQATAQFDTLSLSFRHLSIEDGLSQGMVSAIVQDHYGFMWFGTKDGLNRYDGYSFKVFRHDPSDTTSVGENSIYSLKEDSKGRLWVGTSTGLDLFDHATETFRHVPLVAPHGSGGAVQHIVEDKHGDLWLGRTQGLVKLTFSGEGATQDGDGDIPPFNAHWYSTKESTVSRDASGNLWSDMGDRRGCVIVPWHDGADRIDTVRSAQGDVTPLLHGLCVAADPLRGKLYGVHSTGIVELDPVHGRCTELLSVPVDRGLLTNKSVVVDAKGMLWVPAYFGLYGFDPSTGRLSRCLDPRKTEEAQNVKSAWIDRSGLLWIGTAGYGILTYDPRVERFNTWADGSIRALQPGKDGTVVVTRYEKFLNVFDPAQRKYTTVVDNLFVDHPELRGKVPLGESDFALEGEDGAFWMSCGDLVRFDPRKGTAERFIAHLSEEDNTKRDGWRFPLLLGIDGAIWSGGDTALWRFDTHSYTFTPFRFPIPCVNNPYPFTAALHQGTDGIVWVGTMKGLLRLDPRTGTWKHYTHDPANASTLAVDMIFSIEPDPEDPLNVLWLGTNGGGLNRFDARTGNVTRFTTREGLPNDVVYGVLTDDRGDLWASTNKGLSRYTPRTNVFRNFGAGDGLQSDEFNRHAYCKDATGMLYFGGVNGINYFDPKKLVEDTTSVVVRITDILLMNRSLSFGDKASPLHRPAYLSDGMEIPYSMNMVTFRFASMEFADPSRHRYQYMLENFDPDWIDAGTRNSTIYTNLNPGTYTFRVRGDNADSQWSERSTSFKLVVRPPWWMTGWFYGGCALLVFGSVYGYTRRLRQQKTTLERTVQQRTAELNEEKDRSDDLLNNILPAEVAAELKAKGHADARHFDRVTVLLSDFKNFTLLSERMTPAELVDELNTCFETFDRIMERHGIEKIKTIGDAYLAAGGLPDPLHGSPMEVVKAALEMQSFMDRHRSEREARGKPVFEMRVGIHTGPVVAGIVGVKKFAYDIWGDTVSTTSYLESNCEVGQVNISQSTYALVKDAPGLSFALRGRMEVKGRGEMEMYFVSTA